MINCTLLKCCNIPLMATMVVFLLAVWSRVNDQEAGGEESKKGAPRGHHRDYTDTSNGLDHSTQSRGHQDLTDVHLRKKMKQTQVVLKHISEVGTRRLQPRRYGRSPGRIRWHSRCRSLCGNCRDCDGCTARGRERQQRLINVNIMIQ